MRVRSVHARAFGPLRDATLDLGAGMTVVTGPNEAGKSAWHAALYTAICGVRRGQGQSKAQREFALRHRPWSGGPWEVSARIDLADGRRVELRHDLGGSAECQAFDLDLGRDVSGDVVFEGAPDGSRWLGLDRRTFLATACVNQADVLAVLAAKDTLRDHLQRVATAGGGDATVAAALTAIEGFQAEHVGTERANSTRPIALTGEAVRRAEAALEDARDRHKDFLARNARADAAERDAESGRGVLLAAEAASSRRSAAELGRRIAEARALLERHAEAATAADDEALAGRVAAVLGAGEAPGVSRATHDRPLAELRADLDSLPASSGLPVGADPEVESALHGLREARAGLAAHDGLRPAAPGPRPVPEGVGARELSDLARTLDAPPAPLDQALVDRVEGLRSPAGEQTASGSPVVGFAVAAVGAVLAGVGVATVAVLVALGVVLCAAGLAAALLLRARRRRGDRDRLAAQARAEAALAGHRQAAEETERTRSGAVQRCRELGVEPDPGSLRRAADDVLGAETAARAAAEWTVRRGDVVRHVDGWRDHAAGLLAARGVDVADPRDAAAVAGGCERYLERRHEQDRAEAARVRLSRSVEVREVSVLAGVTGAPDAPEAELLAGLAAWRQERNRRLEAAAAAGRARTEASRLLAGKDLAEAEAAHERLQAAAEAAEAAVPARVVVPTEIEGDPDATVARLRAAAAAAEAIAAGERGGVVQLARTIPDVAVAEEHLAVAQEARSRVERLRDTLTLTAGFLREAEEDVYRDVAPRLAVAVGASLARVTGGRYGEVTVDPETLTVLVRTADGLREASALSHGTTEQVYLLLRVALAAALTAAGESCPILLDDVLVQSDSARKERILTLLHELSRDHQIVLFTQEEDVAGWAARNLDPERDRLVSWHAPDASGAVHSNGPDGGTSSWAPGVMSPEDRPRATPS